MSLLGIDVPGAFRYSNQDIGNWDEAANQFDPGFFEDTYQIGLDNGNNVRWDWAVWIHPRYG